MRKILSIIVVSFVVMLAGCATQPPTLDFIPSDITPSPNKVNAEVKTIVVSIAKEKERLGETQVGLFGNIYEQSFKTSLKEALDESIARSAIFGDLANKKLLLSAKVMKFQTPSFGINFATESIIRYELVDRSNGEQVFLRDITTSGSVSGDYAFLGATRYTEARNISIRENIKQFIGVVSNSDLFSD